MAINNSTSVSHLSLEPSSQCLYEAGNLRGTSQMNNPAVGTAVDTIFVPQPARANAIRPTQEQYDDAVTHAEATAGFVKAAIGIGQLAVITGLIVAAVLTPFLVPFLIAAGLLGALSIYFDGALSQPPAAGTQSDWRSLLAVMSDDIKAKKLKANLEEIEKKNGEEYDRNRSVSVNQACSVINEASRQTTESALRKP